eukprot:1136237-Pelagomonas_calceolata.AAC.2
MASLAYWGHLDVAQLYMCACTSRLPPVYANLEKGPCSGPNCSSECVRSLLQGLLVLVGFGPTERRAKAGRSGQAPIGHLRASCVSWPTPGDKASINFDAAGRRREELLVSAQPWSLRL